MSATSTAKAAAPSARRIRLPLRFSLRLALLGLTAFAIGFPIWYRWPYTEASMVQRPWAQITEHRTVTTWQRQWGGGRKKNGPERVYLDGLLASETMYREGAEDGSYTSYRLTRGIQLQGQYAQGQRTGVWTHFDRNGRVELVERFDDEGLLDGDYEVHPPTGPVLTMKFEWGSLVAINGRPATSRLVDLLHQGRRLPDRMRNALTQPTTMEFVEVPLADAIEYLAASHDLPIVRDAALANSDLPVTLNVHGVNLISGLTLMTAPLDLAADFRYGCIWITTAEDGRDWHDPTGVSDIKAPQGSQLARSWAEKPAVEFVETPLADVLKYLEQSLAIEIDDSALVAAGVAQQPVTLNLKGLPFPDVLGMLLYWAHLRCRLDGETIVVEPQGQKSVISDQGWNATEGVPYSRVPNLKSEV